MFLCLEIDINTTFNIFDLNSVLSKTSFLFEPCNNGSSNRSCPGTGVIFFEVRRLGNFD